MNKELAKTLTTALVQFIDRERPGWSMCCSNAECEAIENAFREDNFFYVETLVERKFSRLTEFEKGLINFYNKRNEIPSDKDGVYNKHDLEELLHKSAKTLLALARKQFIKDGYVIEKKTFHDAVAKVDPEVMKKVSDNVDKENELAKKYLEGYTQGYKDATKFYNDSVVYRNPTIPTTPSVFGCDGIRCTNPQMDCINCQRKTTGGFNTTCGTSTATLHGNTSATDGKEHNPSFTD